MITPRITRLLRVPDLQGMHRVLALGADRPGSRRAGASADQAIVVPTSGAREALQRTLRRAARAEIDDLQPLTRDELYLRLHAAASRRGEIPPLMSGFEREALLGRAAHVAEDGGSPAPFRLRPGLLVEILAFYDELRRRDKTVADFDRLMIGSLEPSVAIDRGAERMFRQTQFLTAAFQEFESLVEGSGRLDEHGLRRWLLEHDAPSPFWRVIVTVSDQAGDARGLWTADYDLLARLDGLERLDIVATENVLASGFHQRVHDLLPGIVEERLADAASLPVLAAPGVPAGADSAGPWFVLRDREEELAAIARGNGGVDPTSRAAIVFQRPLPYIYLARYVFSDADRPYQAVDALPLAGEPFAAGLDLVFAFLITEANRASTIDMLSSPQWRFPELTATQALPKSCVAALDTRLRESKYLGGWAALAALAAACDKPEQRPVDAAVHAAVNAAEALRAVRDAPAASAQFRALLSFIEQHEQLPEPEAPWSARHLRARAAVLEALESLADAHARHDDEPMSPERLAGIVRRWIEGQTFAPVTGSEGVWLLDSAAAPYADVDDLRIVGLVESDWPARARRSIFYPGSLLAQLGWPTDVDRLAAERARFQDLLRLPRRRVSVSTFTLEDDAIVSPSSFLEELESSGLTVERAAGLGDALVFAHEALVSDTPPAHMVSPGAEDWLALRRSRTSGEDPAYHGQAGPREPGVYAISHVERYLECPFKYFAGRVLRLGEERDDESGLTPQERGQLLHEVFEAFFAQWHARGGRAITADTLADALALFETVAEARLAALPETDRALERTHLLGSAVAPGLAERAFTFEIEHDIGVVERLLEHPLEGTFEMRGERGRRPVQIRAKADRIDLLADGTLRVIDYKLGRAPKTWRALQLPIYGVCAAQHLEGRHGRRWTVSRAGYVAFKEKNAFVALGSSTSLDQALEDGERRLVAAVEGIERGDFAVRPEEPFLCTRCGYAGVCRKDYVGDE